MAAALAKTAQLQAETASTKKIEIELGGPAKGAGTLYFAKISAPFVGEALARFTGQYISLASRITGAVIGSTTGTIAWITSPVTRRFGDFGIASRVSGAVASVKGLCVPGMIQGVTKTGKVTKAGTAGLMHRACDLTASGLGLVADVVGYSVTRNLVQTGLDRFVPAKTQQWSNGLGNYVRTNAPEWTVGLAKECLITGFSGAVYGTGLAAFNLGSVAHGVNVAFHCQLAQLACQKVCNQWIAPWLSGRVKAA